MQIQIESQPFSSVAADALVAFVFDEDNRLTGTFGELTRVAKDRLTALIDSGEITGKPLELVLVHFPEGFTAQRLLLVGAGKREKFKPAADLRRVAGTALRYLKSRGAKKIAILAPQNDRGPAAAQTVVEGLYWSDFESDKYRTEKKPAREIQSVTLIGFDSSDSAALNSAIERGRTIGESANFARDLINDPPNRLTPKLLASRAEAMAKEVGLGIEILDERKIAELKMGALIGVAQGSNEPPRVIVVRYKPENPKANAPTLGLVGKAVTFDSGGLSLKSAGGMEKMKYDMGGGATVLAAMRALAFLKPSIPVICVIPATENMPGGRAQRPGDVVTAMSGKTIEVLNTDAEGRLILADAVHYARKLGATHLIDAATLTGAVEVALGNVHVGAFGTPREFLDQFLESAKAAGEKMWPLPIDDDYQQFIKSEIADIRNTGSGKGGGATIGAWFIKEFVDDTPWVHLDIAATTWIDEGRPWLAKGPSGVAIRSIIDFALKL